MLTPGDPLPLFGLPCSTGRDFQFGAAGGRYLLLCLYPSAADAKVQALFNAYAALPFFDDQRASCFGLTRDASDMMAGRLLTRVPGLRHFIDADGAVTAKLGFAGESQPVSLLLDQNFHVLAMARGGAPADHAASMARMLTALPPLGPLGPAKGNAPVLVVPHVFEPEFCRHLIGLYESQGGESSGFMQSDPEGRTIYVQDTRHKVRRDVILEDEALKTQIRMRIQRRLLPEIKKTFQFEATRIERYLVACYDAAEVGHFNPHRDNTTRGTAHRRFAVTIGLNAEEYDGGDLRFPEFDLRHHRAPTGGAIVFSCSMLHEVLPMTRGRRFAFLPFLFDEAGETVRQANLRYVDPAVGGGGETPALEPKPAAKAKAKAKRARKH
jgi:predicted 2-oxoglutarate/Fe(II)-dependent dioxygenase YbiX/peroxiredoxin